MKRAYCPEKKMYPYPHGRHRKNVRLFQIKERQGRKEKREAKLLRVEEIEINVS